MKVFYMFKYFILKVMEKKLPEHKMEKNKQFKVNAESVGKCLSVMIILLYIKLKYTCYDKIFHMILVIYVINITCINNFHWLKLEIFHHDG